MDRYIQWRQWTLEHTASAYAQLTRLDTNVFAEVFNFLSRVREDASQSAEVINSLTLKLLSVLRSSADFASRAESYFKSVLKVASRLSSRPDLMSFLQDADLLSSSTSAVIVKNASLPKANSYFRCLMMYSQTAARENVSASVEKALNIHNATFKTLCESQLHSLLVDLESFSLRISIAMLRWISWTNKPSDGAAKLLTTSLQQALATSQTITSIKGSFRIFDKSGFTDEYHSMVKVVGQLKEWPESVLRLKPAVLRQLPAEAKEILRDLHKEYANIYERCAKEEESMNVPANMQYFKAWQCVSIALGVVAILSIEIGDMDLGMAYFEKAEACIRSNAVWSGLKQLFQQLHLAVGFVADAPARLPQAIAWMKQSCALHQEYFELFPKEKSSELSTKLGFLASLESRALSGPQPARSSSALPKSTIQSSENLKRSETASFGPNWTVTDLLPVIDLHLKKQLKSSPSLDESNIQLFFDSYSAKISSERVQDYLKLVEFESNLFFHYNKPSAQLRLINAALEISSFTSTIERARLLILRAIGLRKSAKNVSLSSQDDSAADHEASTANLAASDLFEAISLLSSKTADESPEGSRILADLAMCHSLCASAILEAPTLSSVHYIDTSSTTLGSLDTIIDTSIELYSKTLARMLSVVVGEESDRSISRALLDQNRSHWSSIDTALEQINLLRDLLHFREDHRRFIALSKLLLKFLATLCPFGLEHGDRARSLVYAQIGASFHALGYDEPLASKYFAKSGSADESSLVERLLQIQRDEAHIAADTSDWLSHSVQYLHDLGRIPEFDYVGHLETVSEQLDAEMDETWHTGRFAFLQKTRASIQFALAHIKSTSGHIDEAIIDALVAFRLRAPSAPKKPNTAAPSTPSKQVITAPPFSKPTCWTHIKNFMASMDQVGRLYSMQGSVAEARYYYGMALQMALKHENKAAEFHFNIQLAQLDLESGEGAAFPLSTSENADSLTLTNASALILKGNAFLRKLSLSEARDSYSEAENILLTLIESRYVQHLEHSLGEEEPASKAKAPARGRGAKKASAAATSTLASDRYRFSMSPAKLPKTTAGSLPSDYIGLKRIQLRISMKLATVDYERARQEAGDCMASLDEALSRLNSTKEQLEELGECALVQYDLAIVMLNQAKVIIAQYEAENQSGGFAHWTIGGGPSSASSASSSASSAPTAKRGSSAAASKSKQSVDRLLLARETLNAAFALSTSAGSIPKISSDICQYFVEVHGLIDPWTTIARQNSAIGITMRHQLLENLYRLGAHKLAQDEQEEGEEVEEGDDENAVDDDVEALSKGVKALSVDDCDAEEKEGDENAEALLASALREVDFKDEQMSGDDFKRTFVDILGEHEETQRYTVVTVSLGPEGRSLVISRLSHGDEEPLVARINLSKPIDEDTEKSFASLVDESSNDASENEEANDSLTDSLVSPALMRSATALLAPLLKSSSSSLSSSTSGQPSLKRSSSSVQPSLSASSGSSSRSRLQASADSQPATAAKATTATRAKRASSTSSTASAAPKRASAATSRARKPLASIEDLGVGELDDMLSNLNVSPSMSSEETSDGTTPSLSSSQSSSSDSDGQTPKDPTFKRFFKEFERIIADSKANAVTSSMKNEESVSSKEFNYQWWARRYALDDRLNAWLSNFEDCALGPYKTLFAGQLCDSKLSSAIESRLGDLKTRVEKTLKVPAGSLPSAYFRCLALGSDATSLRDAMDTIRVLCGWNEANGIKNAISLKTAAQLVLDTMATLSSGSSNSDYRVTQSLAMSGLYRAFADENADEEIELDISSRDPSDASKTSTLPVSKITKRIVRRQKRHPVIFIFDKHLHSLPWESLPIVRCNPCSRVPSIHALRSAVSSLTRSGTEPNVTRDGIDASKLFYILNPSQDLSSSQQTLEPLLKSQKTWSGVSGSVPTMSDYARALEQSNLMLYAGHNSGAQYLAGEANELRKVRARAGGCVVWMMGCSSLRLKDHADFDPSGLGLTYLMSGAPAVVGNLWDVTTRDLDKATVSLINWLHKDDALTFCSSAASGALSHLSNSTLPEAILKARSECKLQFINAAALVSYGLPLRTKRNEEMSSAPAFASTAPAVAPAARSKGRASVATQATSEETPVATTKAATSSRRRTTTSVTTAEPEEKAPAALPATRRRVK